MALQKSDSAPDFTLASTKDKNGFKLSANLGQGKGILLAFYPFDWSPVCTNELGYLNANLKEFTSAGVTVVAISVDSPFSHAAWNESQKLRFPLLSDFNREVIKAFGVVTEDFMGLKGFAKRSVFLLDAKGIVQYAWVSENPGVEPDYKSIMKAVAAL